eukprot:6087951-Amphidinium_carterae.1
MAETAALVEGLSNLEWLIAWRKWVETETRPTSNTSHLGEIELQAIEKNSNDLQQQALAVVDSKSLYDVIRGTNIDGVERQAGLESLLARDLLKSLKATIRWIPHEHNPSDSMTKISANHECLMSMLQTSTVRLRPASEILEERKEYRETTGKSNPRPKNPGFQKGQNEMRRNSERSKGKRITGVCDCSILPCYEFPCLQGP